MEIVFKKGKIFKKLIEFCNPLISVANLKVNNTGIHLNTIDTNNVALILFDINTDSFKSFKIDEEEIIFTIGLERLCKVFKTYKDTDEMKIKYTNNSDRITFTFKNSRTKKTVTQKVPLLNQIDDNEFDIPEIDYDSTIKINPMIISGIVKDCSTFGENIKIETIEGEDGNKIKFSVNDMEGDSEFFI